MPIKKSGKGYKFGDSGHVYPTKEGAKKQMRAMYANGYKGEGHKEGGKVGAKTKPKGKKSK